MEVLDDAGPNINLKKYDSKEKHSMFKMNSAESNDVEMTNE